MEYSLEDMCLKMVNFVSADSAVFWYFISQYLLNCFSDPYKTNFFEGTWWGLSDEYINCFNRSRFLAEVSTNLQKMYYFCQFKGHNSGKKKLDKWPHFFIYFLSSNCSWYYICIWKMSKFVITWSPLWSILICKIPKFLRKHIH